MKMSDDNAYMPNRPRVLTQFGGTSFRSSSDAQKRVPPRVSGGCRNQIAATTSTQLMTDACYR
jgi:hypothetical protein